jgi:serine/threonine protein kinase
LSDQPFPPNCATRFKPERLLGQGGFGDVWLATQIGLERPVAIKFIRTGEDVDAEQLQRFRNEAHVTSRLSHPCIVKVIDHDVEDGVPWIAYEYLPGRSLAQVLQSGPLQWEQALSVAQQIAGALEEAHDKGVIHRDIKPDNVLEVAPGVFKLADFGIAKWTAPSHVRTKTGFILGTPTHVPPEQIKGDPASPAGDVYALGVVLYQMLTGQLPFDDESMLGILRRHLEEKPKTPSRVQAGLPPDVDLLVKQALEKTPGKRFSDGGAMKRALEAVARPGGADAFARPAVDAPPPPQVAGMSTGRIKRPGIVRADSSTRAVSRSGVDVAPPPPPLAPERRGLHLAAAAFTVFVLGGAALVAAIGPKPVASPPPSPTATPSPPPPERDLTSELDARLKEIYKLSEDFRHQARREVPGGYGSQVVTNLTEVVPLMDKALARSTDLVQFLRAERIRGPVWAFAVYPAFDQLMILCGWIYDQPKIGNVRKRADALDKVLGAEQRDLYERFVQEAVAARRAVYTKSNREAGRQLKDALAVLEGTAEDWLRSIQGVRIRQFVAHAIVGLVEKGSPAASLGDATELSAAWRKEIDVAAEFAKAPGNEKPGSDILDDVLRLHATQIETAGRLWKATYLGAVERQLAAEQLHDAVRRLSRYDLDGYRAKERKRILGEAEKILRKHGSKTKLADGTEWPKN